MRLGASVGRDWRKEEETRKTYTEATERTEFAEKTKSRRKERARCPIIRAHPSLKNARGTRFVAGDERDV
jgi:hypothetical protein